MDCSFLWRPHKNKKVKPQNIQPITDDVFPFRDYCCGSQWNLIDQVDEYNCIHHDNEHAIYQRNTFPGTNTTSFAYNILPSFNDSEIPSVFLFHVIFNLAGSCLTRYRHHIKGTRAQQCFIQHLASTITGTSIPFLYLMVVCLPLHFYLQSSHHYSAILGCSPISCYCGEVNPHCFTSILQTTWNFVTNSWFPSSNCPLFLGFCYHIKHIWQEMELIQELLGEVYL